MMTSFNDDNVKYITSGLILAIVSRTRNVFSRTQSFFFFKQLSFSSQHFQTISIYVIIENRIIAVESFLFLLIAANI